MTPLELLNEECKYIGLVYQATKADIMLATCLCAKIHFAYTCNLINKNDFLSLMDKARYLLHEET